MIKLFNINNYVIDTSKFNNVLNGEIVYKFENEFAKYVGAKYACGVNSATNAIFLSLLNKSTEINVPSIIPPVVLNAILLSGNSIKFQDNVDWVGGSYTLKEFEDYKIIDSAQKVEKNQFKKEANENDLMIFSFYPTKPVGGIDGGIIVSNDKLKIDWFRKAVMNGTSQTFESWGRKISFPGWKSYLSSSQAFVARENLNKLDAKNKRLTEVLEFYNSSFKTNNNSLHLFRLDVENRSEFIDSMNDKGIICGIHYSAMHLNDVYKNSSEKLVLSEHVDKHTVSIPFHEMLTNDQLEHIVNCCRKLL